ncbi:MAG TPA: hypothetical protein IAB59_01795 [Candidatus Onthousia faecipullorum]|uniref:Uncharacterized protein n=1 Tax=Candidatus Onthousia faecipullorum TaxID=2840887 RepID=A0A9D1KAG4_9FIRM|nr:hypothetical protein [Candidatus Onthousia faecipullorum]
MKRMEKNDELMLIYTFNSSNAVIPECQRDLYEASLLGIKNVRLFQSFTDEDREVDFLRSQKVCDKLVKTCQILGYDLIEINGSIKGKGFSSQIVSYDRDSRLIKPTRWFNLKNFIDNNFSALENRESVGKRLIKRNESVNNKI